MEHSLEPSSISSVMEEVRRLEGRDAKAAHSKHDRVVGAPDREGQASSLANGLVRQQLSQPKRVGTGLERPGKQAGANSFVIGSQNAAYKAGKVPNFAALHASWAKRLAAAKAAVQRRLTVPKV